MSDQRDIPGGVGAPGQDSGAAELRGMSGAEVLDLKNRLTLFAGRYYGPLNCDCEDLAMQALTDVLSGKREGSWDSSYTPFDNLCLILRSNADNQLQKQKRSVQLDPDSTVLASPSQADDYETDETRRRIGSALDRVTREDKFLQEVVTHGLDEGWKPRRIAKELHVEVSEVYNARKRIRRKLKSLSIKR